MMKGAFALILILVTVLCTESRFVKRHFDDHYHGSWNSPHGSWNSPHGSHSDHWGNSDSWSKPRPGHGGHCNFSEEQNKKLVMDFYQEVFGDKNIEAADKYISATTYIQHNPQVADGLGPFKTALKEWFAGAPKEKMDFQHTGADGNLVWLHVKTMDQGKVASVMDIFRMECGKIVEHWDVLQQVPDKAANNHPMF